MNVVLQRVNTQTEACNRRTWKPQGIEIPGSSLGGGGTSSSRNAAIVLDDDDGCLMNGLRLRDVNFIIDFLKPVFSRSWPLPRSPSLYGGKYCCCDCEYGDELGTDRVWCADWYEVAGESGWDMVCRLSVERPSESDAVLDDAASPERAVNG